MAVLKTALTFHGTEHEGMGYLPCHALVSLKPPTYPVFTLPCTKHSEFEGHQVF